jgi:hypothetical protein
MNWRLAFSGLWAAWTALACSVSPVPEPPQADPELHSAIDLEPCDDCSTVILRGQPGATENASHVWAVNLDRPDEPVEAPILPDGSFSLAVEVGDGDDVRLQARRGLRRSAPRDYQINASRFTERFFAAPRPLVDCFPAPFEWHLGSAQLGQSITRSLQLPSSCASELRIAAIRLRSSLAALRVDGPAAPLVIASGETLTVTLTFTPTTPGLVEDILLLEIASPSSDRRAIQVLGDAPP